jgi:hypothetical protein
MQVAKITPREVRPWLAHPARSRRLPMSGTKAGRQLHDQGAGYLLGCGVRRKYGRSAL